MRISDWSSDVCSSDLGGPAILRSAERRAVERCHVNDIIGMVVAVEIGGFGKAGLVRDMQEIPGCATFLTRRVEIGADFGRKDFRRHGRCGNRRHDDGAAKGQRRELEDARPMLSRRITFRHAHPYSPSRYPSLRSSTPPLERKRAS